MRAGLARARDDIDDARRQISLLDDPGEMERGQRRRFRGLQHDRVAAGERGRDLPGRHQQRKVPGNDLAADADRGDGVAGEGVLELIGPARVVKKVRDREWNIHVA